MKPVVTADIRARDTFADVFGDQPTGIWVAPGRVNLIGEHTDYNDGFVLPFALPLRTAVAARAGESGRWRVWSEAHGTLVTITPPDPTTRAVHWSDYVAGVIWALRAGGHTVPGADFALASDVPFGAGLSSSAALECAILAALCDLGNLDIPTAQRPVIAQNAENSYVGVPCGIMDQTASTLCRAGHALFVDCLTGEHHHLPLTATILVTDTRAAHRLVDGEYAARRTTCHEAAGLLGVASLRGAHLEDLDRLTDATTRRRARHVITENSRVLRSVACLRLGDLTGLGALMTESHASMRDDYEITVPEVDLAVTTALASGAYGARMTGAGFGGCVISLIEPGAADRIASAVATAFAQAGYGAPRSFTAIPSSGAGRLTPDQALVREA